MTEEEFVALARSKWSSLKALAAEKDFYEYEKRFDELWVEFGRETLEKSISEPPADRRKKKDNEPLWKHQHSEDS